MDWIKSIREIKKAQENNQLVIFVGAGVSKNSKVPTWWELIKRFADEIEYDRCESCKKKDCNLPKDECEDCYDFTQDEFLRIPEYYYQQHKEDNSNAYYNLIQDTLRGGTGPNLIDDEIFNILPHHIITTNYDSLLEDSTVINSRLYRVVSQDSDLLSKSSERYIIKMHGDLELPETIVLKESDYIDYEQKHPLISTFIRSLLVNHTFVFLGYSLNDYNLNLIIGWINYFRKIYGVEERPLNFLISAKAATTFEQARLEDKNIFVINLDSLPDDIENRAKIEGTLENESGRKLLAYLRCISDPKIMQGYIPLEERLIEKYQLLEAYSKISYQDLIEVYPLGRTKFLDTELVFYEKDWYDRISEILENEDSLIVEVFRRAGISAIHCFNDDARKEIPGVFEPFDKLFQLYIENDYIQLEKELARGDNPSQKLYYYHLLGKCRKEIDEILEKLAKESTNSYVAVIMQKMRARTARLAYWDLQEIQTKELERLFDTTPSKYNNAISFLRMLFNSEAKNKFKMEKLLDKHEKRYEYGNNTIYFDHAHINLWELKAYAYDYYFFFKENGIPLHYFSNPKEYLSYYLQAILCTYSPTGKSPRSDSFGVHTIQQHYALGEIELDMFVKYADAKALKNWLKKYSVREIEIEEGVDVVKKFKNLCSSLECFGVRDWTKHLECFAILISVLNLNEQSQRDILDALTVTIEKTSTQALGLCEELFSTVNYLVHHMFIDNSEYQYKRLLNSLMGEKIYPLLVERQASGFEYVTKKLADYTDEATRKRLMSEIETIDEIKEKSRKVFSLRHVLESVFCELYFKEHLDVLTSSQIFNLLIEGTLKYSEECWAKFVDTISKEDAKRVTNPGMRSYPDWLLVTIEESMILKLFGFPVELEQLESYAHYSEHLQFMLNPVEFDYSKVNIGDYMWQNLIYSKEYREYFIKNKEIILTEELKNSFELGVETKEQQKIVYGILLGEDEIQKFNR